MNEKIYCNEVSKIRYWSHILGSQFILHIRFI